MPRSGGAVQPEGPPVTMTVTRIDPDTGEQITTEYLSLAEAAKVLHCSTTHVGTMTRERRWPSYNAGKRRWLSWRHIERIIELETTDIDELPPAPDPPRLGTPVADTDVEPIR